MEIHGQDAVRARSSGPAAVRSRRPPGRGRAARDQSFLCRAAYPSLFSWRARATASASGGTSFVMTDPAAVHAPSPTSTGATKAFWTPVLTFLPTLVRAFGCPGLCGTFAVLA